MPSLASLGHFFFRTRNVVFPLLLIVTVLVFPPRALNAHWDSLLIAQGVIVLLIGQGLRVTTIGLDYIRRGGKDGRIYASRLVTGGLFSCCRNPMYTGNILMVLGFLIIADNLAGLIVGGALACFIYRAIVAGEEQFLEKTFGEEYRGYCQRVPRWIPHPARLAATVANYRFDWPSVVIREYGTLFTTILIVHVLLGWKAARADTLGTLAPALIVTGVVTVIAYLTARYLKKSRRLQPLKR